MKKNKLIVLEGIDGVGKSSLAIAIKDLLEQKGIKAVLYESVEDKESGFNTIKPFIKTVSVTSSHLFYLASSVNKSEIIEKMLKDNWVICDRYVYSTMAFHYARGSKLVMNPEDLGILKPDYCFLITLKEDIRKERVLKRERNALNDLVPRIKGTLPYKMDLHLRKMNLIKVDNSGDFNKTLAHIEKYLTLS